MSTSTVDSKLTIKWLATIIVPLLILLIPTSEMFTMQLKLFLVITIMSMFMLCLELMDSLWVGLFMPGCWILFGVCGPAEAFAPYTQTQVWMVIGGFIMAGALGDCGVLNRLAYWALRKCHGHFNRILYVFFFVGVILSAVTFTGCFMLIFLIGYSICKVFKQDKTIEAAVIMMVAQLAGVSVAVYTYAPTHFGLISSGINSVLPNLDIQWYHQIVYGAPLFFISLFTIFFLTKIYNTKSLSSDEAMEYFNNEYEKMGKMTIIEKKAIVVTLIIVGWLIASSFINIDGSIALILLPLLYFIPGVRVANKDTFKSVNFSMVIFLASCMSIGTVGVSLGLGEVVSAYLLPFMSHIPLFLAPLAVLIFGILANTVMTPAAMFALFPASLTQIAMELGMSTPWPLNLPLLYVNDLVFFPYEQTLCLILFGFGVMRMNDFIKLNIIKMVIFAIGFMVLVVPYWMLLGLF